MHLKLGGTDKALQAYRKGLELSEALAKVDPNDAQAVSDISTSYYKIAQAYQKTNDLARAREWDEKMLAADRQLSDRMPRNAGASPRGCQRLPDPEPDLRRGRGRPAAVSYAKQALEHARAGEIAGATQPFRWDFAITLRMLADAQIGAGQFQEARQIIEEVFKAGPQSAGGSSYLAWLLATHWADPIRDGKKAIELARKACELTEWKTRYSSIRWPRRMPRPASSTRR